MQNELNQEEIDAMVRAARTGGGQAESKRREPKVEPWDVRRAGQIGREQLQAITRLHEGFARSLTIALGSYLRVVFAAALVSEEHLTYREFTGRIPETDVTGPTQIKSHGGVWRAATGFEGGLSHYRFAAGRRRQGSRSRARDHRD